MDVPEPRPLVGPPGSPSKPPYYTVNGCILTIGDVAFVREVKQDGAPVRKVQVLAENGPVLTLDTFSVQDNEWLNAPVYADVRRLELVYRPVEHPTPEAAPTEELKSVPAFPNQSYPYPPEAGGRASS